MIGFEKKSKDLNAKIEALELYACHFNKVLVNIHELQPGELQGTCSNTCACQLAAAHYFKNHENVIFSKFDSNAMVKGEYMLQEIEMAWFETAKDERDSLMFKPFFLWGDHISRERSLFEIQVSNYLLFGNLVFPNCMSYVGGSLKGIIEVGFTPPCKLAEDESILITMKTIKN